MRIALISDLHANLIALETVLADIARAHIDRIACLGDIVCNGPQPRAVLRRLREIGCAMVLGNADEILFKPPQFDPSDARERKVVEIILWSLGQLTADETDIIRAFPLTTEIALEHDARLLGFHGSPRANTHVIVATTPDDELATMLGDQRATVMAGGHTHTQMLRRFRSALVINPGSVGMPMERGATRAQDRRPPFSEYAIVDSRGDDLAVEFRRVPLDVGAVVRAARESGMPNVEVWAGEWIGQ
ncbi:MAG: metallophosphoesterase family protein [Chloroflexi bacterium]|nr:metallophosphoesterase family protein [Chloroflexota bacterium]